MAAYDSKHKNNNWMNLALMPIQWLCRNPPSLSGWMESLPLKCCAQWIGMVLFKETKSIFLCKYVFFAIQNIFPFNSWQAQLLIRINHYFRSFPFSPSAWWISLVSWSLELLWAVMLLFIHISPIPLEPTLLILSPNLNL